MKIDWKLDIGSWILEIGYWKFQKMTLSSLLSAFFLLLGIRTALWHLQCWQLREYRLDRMKAHFENPSAKRDLWNLWFFRGILPRPRKSGRIFMILGIFLFLSGTIFFPLEEKSGWIFLWVQTNISKEWALPLTFLIWERTLFLTTSVSVLLSLLPVWPAQQILFARAKRIIQRSGKMVRIGITGSFGKSSTKEMLVHLLRKNFGTNQVLANPENQNNEVAIARLILKNKKFFSHAANAKTQKFFVVEIGAYRSGEIQKVCQFVQPHIGILTGINAQHISLFGSQEKILKAKFELAEAALDKVFFNADSPLLNQIFEDQRIHATPIPIAKSAVKNMKVQAHQTEFEIFGEKFVLPWGGEFFVGNALLALETARELGVSVEKLRQELKTLPPLLRALNVQKQKSGATILHDLYSANPDGVMQAIEHLKHFPGKKVFVGQPLLELGVEAENVHRRIFESLREIKAEVFWLKPDFADLGHEICGAKFRNHDVPGLKKIAQSLKIGDGALLESRLPESVIKLFA